MTLQYRDPSTGLYTPVAGMDPESVSYPSVGVRVYDLNPNQTYTAATPTLLTFGSTYRDDLGFKTSDTRLTVPAGQPGAWYRVTYSVAWEGASLDQWEVWIRKNGTEYQIIKSNNDGTGAVAYTGGSGTCDVYLESGDYIEAWVELSSTYSSSTNDHSLSMVRLDGLEGPAGVTVTDEPLEYGNVFPNLYGLVPWQRFLRTDVYGGTEFYWYDDEGIWLTRQHFQTHSARTNNTNTSITSAGWHDAHALPGDFDIFVSRYNIKAHIATTHDGSNYWWFRSMVNPSNVYTWIKNTGGTGGINTWTDHSVTAARWLDKSEKQMHWYVSKIGAPGALDFGARLEYQIRMEYDE